MGRVLMACTRLGFYELRPGERVLYSRPGGGSIHVSDLGPCTQATLDECKAKCEAHWLNLCFAAVG